VVSYLAEPLRNLERAFSGACLRAGAHFAERHWGHDPNLFAFEVRKDVFEAVRRNGGEDWAEEGGYDLDVSRLPLCGLLLKTPLIHLRVRKSRDGEIPRPEGSLEDFYQRNLFTLLDLTDDKMPLNLMLLWDADQERRLRRFWLGCPKADGLQWHWRVQVGTREDQVDHGRTFREAFEAENSDVPMSRRPDAEDVARRRKKQNEPPK
jgi:hypothetical protein